jgi:ketosteroid isomerase-like protein/catechol 2,3-dioxygenase-like lactoylglutathione lyase family enzyme
MPANTPAMPRLLSLLMVCFLSSAAAAQDTGKDIEILRDLIAQTAKAINAHDADGIMAHYSRDVRVSYPGVPDTTYDVFDRSYRQMLAPTIVTSTVPAIDEILVSGDLATIRMVWSTTITDKASGRTSSRQAKDLQVWRRESGAWKFFRGMWHHIRPDAPRPGLFAISVPKLEEAIAWYRDMLEMTLVREIPVPEQTMRIAILEREGFRVELVELAGSAARSTLAPKSDNPALIQGFGKIGFTVAELDRWEKALRAKGVRFQLEPRAGADGSRSFIVVDRHGNWLQFSTPQS